MTIREMCKRAQETSRAKGFVTEDPHIDQKLLLAVGELVEAQNEIRDGKNPEDLYAVSGVNNVVVNPEFLRKRPGWKPEGFGVELADAVIRIGQLAEHVGVDLETCIELKMAYNDTRPHMHGKKF